MSTSNLVNTVKGPGGLLYYAGTAFDTVGDAALITDLEAAGGVLAPNANGTISAAALVAQQIRSVGGTIGAMDTVMQAAYASVQTTGAQGATGAQGVAGAQGAAGAQGSQGHQGFQG